jgi:hypothetical protein
VLPIVPTALQVWHNGLFRDNYCILRSFAYFRALREGLSNQMAGKRRKAFSRFSGTRARFLNHAGSLTACI